jgi:hypothetical protein
MDTGWDLRDTCSDIGDVKFFASNIDRRGRLARAVLGGMLIIAGVALAWVAWWACVILVLSGCFTLFEAARGWCLLRACGLKTRL